MELFLDAILDPWRWNDQLRVYWPIVAEGVLVSVALGLIGCFLVVRGTSLLGDALSHSVLPGIVIGFLIGGSLHSPWILVGATAVGMAAALLVQSVHGHSRVKEDASLGIVFTTLFAIGVVMINLFAGQADLDPGCVLYGNIEHFVLQPEAIFPMAVILGGIVLGLIVFYRQLLVSTFDPALAISLGIPATLIHYLVMAALSLTVVTSFEAVGAILAVALLITPGATARLWTDRMPRMLVLAAAHGVLATLLGYWLSHEAVLNTSAAGAISVAGFGLFTMSWLVSPHAGLVTRLVTRRRLLRTVETENLLKAIDDLSVTGGSVTDQAVAGELRLAPSHFSAALARGMADDFVRRGEGGALTLTDKGRARSRQVKRAHELWEQFLQREVGLGPDHVHDAAEWIEHHLSQEDVEHLDQTLRQAKDEPRPQKM
ncbi:MAG: metal ABC transporter permease [Tepidisphaeraceae bacterium]